MTADALNTMTRLAQTSDDRLPEQHLVGLQRARHLVTPRNRRRLRHLTRHPSLPVVTRSTKRSTVISRTWAGTPVSRAGMARVPSDQLPTASPI